MQFTEIPWGFRSVHKTNKRRDDTPVAWTDEDENGLRVIKFDLKFRDLITEHQEYNLVKLHKLILGAVWDAGYLNCDVGNDINFKIGIGHWESDDDHFIVYTQGLREETKTEMKIRKQMEKTLAKEKENNE